MARSYSGHCVLTCAGMMSSFLLWDELIERPRQDVCRAVVWDAQDGAALRQLKERTLARRFAQYPTIAEQVSAEARRLAAQLPVQNAQFRARFPQAQERSRAALLAIAKPGQ